MRKLLSTILFALLCCYAMAYDFSAVCSTGQTLYYNITSDVEPYTVEVTSEVDGGYNTMPEGDLEIPETVEYNSITYSVTSIGDYAFYVCYGLTSITIPNSVMNFGIYAFSGCDGLTSVTIPNSVITIGDYAFGACSGLESIIIGSNVTNIGTDVFYSCSGLSSISVEGNNSTFDSRDNCNAIIQTETNNLLYGCKNTTIPSTVISIGQQAFYGSGLESISIPSSVTSIGGLAFYDCTNLTEITIPESITSIDGNVFTNCVALESIVVDGNNSTYDSRDNCNAIIETGTNTLITGCKSTIIPNSITIIGQDAFSGSGVRKVYIPNSVTNIAYGAFYNCRSLTSVTIGNSVAAIGDLAFWSADNLTEINIFSTTPPALSENSFYEEIYTTATVWVPRGTGGIYMNTEFWTQFSIIREVPYYWSCDFEGDETWTFGNDQQDGNVQWQILTPETYPSGLISGDNAYIKPFVFNGDTLSNTPYHWAMADLVSQSTDFGGPGQVAESSWIEFSWIDLSEAAQPQITFRQIFRQLNDVETSIRVSTDGGQTWTDHIVNEEVEDNTYGEYEIRTGIREAAGEGNVKIRFLINSDAHVVQMGYGWEIDDIEIKEAPDTIIATAGEGGTISPNGEVLVDIGESVTFTITPNDGYRIASVMVDETENVTDQLVDGTYTFVDVIENHTIAATFEEIHTYTIIVLSNNDAYGMVSEGGTFEEGAVFMIEAMPNDGYRFVSWNDGNAENPRTITVTSDSTFVANFALSSSSDIQAKFFTDANFTAEADSSMTILSTEEFVIYPAILNAGPDEAADTVTIDIQINGNSDLIDGAQSMSLASQPLPVNQPATILQDDGALSFSADQMDSYGLTDTFELCFIANYSGNDLNTENNTVCVTVTRQQQYTITALSNNDAYGSVSGSGTYEEGTEITLTAIPYEGYRFYQWQDGNTENPRSITVTSDSTFVATFTPTPLPESINITDYNGNTYDIDALLDDGKYVVFAFFFTTCHYSQEEVPYVESIYTQMGCNTADVILIGLAVVNSNEPSTIEWFMDEFGATYPIASLEDNPINVTLFDDWGLDGTPTYILIQPNRSMIEMSRPPSADQLIAFGAHESPCLDTTYTITVLSNNEAYGSVSGGGTYEDGDTIIITAMPNGGYLFDSWEDDNAENPRTITVTSDSTFVADFVKCEITQTIDTVVPNFVTVGEHTFYSTGNYSFSVLSENDCDTIFDIRLRVLAEPVYDIGPNPTKSLLNINSDGFISAVEFYSVTGQLVMRKEVNGYEAEFDMEGLVDGVYILRIYGDESSLPAVSKVVKE